MRQSHLIVKEEEQEHFIVDIWNASEEMQPKEFAEFVKGKYFINLKP